MNLLLRGFFLLVLASMLAVTSWASLQCALFNVPRAVATHPWFIATLFDAYWGFLTFFAWLCFRQRRWADRATWLVAILLLGNIAMAAYGLRTVWNVHTRAELATALTTPREGSDGLGLALATLGVAVIGFAALA